MNQVEKVGRLLCSPECPRTSSSSSWLMLFLPSSWNVSSYLRICLLSRWTQVTHSLKMFLPKDCSLLSVLVPSHDAFYIPTVCLDCKVLKVYSIFESSSAQFWPSIRTTFVTLEDMQIDSSAPSWAVIVAQGWYPGTYNFRTLFAYTQGWASEFPVPHARNLGITALITQVKKQDRLKTI